MANCSSTEQEHACTKCQPIRRYLSHALPVLHILDPFAELWRQFPGAQEVVGGVVGGRVEVPRVDDGRGGALLGDLLHLLQPHASLRQKHLRVFVVVRCDCCSDRLPPCPVHLTQPDFRMSAVVRSFMTKICTHTPASACKIWHSIFCPRPQSL